MNRISPLDRRRDRRGHVRPHRPGVQPGDGGAGGEVDFASVAEVDAAVAARQGGLPGLAGHRRSAGGPR